MKYNRLHDIFVFHILHNWYRCSPTWNTRGCLFSLLLDNSVYWRLAGEHLSRWLISMFTTWWLIFLWIRYSGELQCPGTNVCCPIMSKLEWSDGITIRCQCGSGEDLNEGLWQCPIHQQGSHVWGLYVQGLPTPVLLLLFSQYTSQWRYVGSS